jgi:signal transduction histidine kinase
MTGRAQAAGVKLDATLDPGLEPVYLDSERIQICLISLLENALDACVQDDAAGKTVDIKTGPAPGRGVEYRITDDGCGMDAETRSKIFQNFFTTKGSKGTGMGLMIAGKTVDAHGGKIEIDSRIGRGTTVVVRLPEQAVEKKTSNVNTVE